MTDLTEKQILINQIVTDLEMAKDRDEVGAGTSNEIRLVLKKVKKLKDIEDKEVNDAEKDGGMEDKEQ